MFLLSDLQLLLDGFPNSCLISNIRLEKFDLDFDQIDTEDSEIIVRSKPTYTRSLNRKTRPQDFWLRALWERGYKTDLQSFKDYACSGIFKPLSQDEFNSHSKGMLEYHHLKHLDGSNWVALPLHEARDFCGAMLMYNEWYDKGLFAEYEDEYIAVFSTRTS